MADLILHIALTFEDGPDGVPLHTPAKGYNTSGRILAALEKGVADQKLIQAAFFVQTHVAERMASEAGRKEVERAIKAKHVLAIQNGSATDKLGHPESAATTLQADLERAAKALTDLGAPPPRFVRGPLGRVNAKAVEVYQRLTPPLRYAFWHISADDDFQRKNPYRERIERDLTTRVREFANLLRWKQGQDGTTELTLVARFWDTSVFTAAWLPEFLAAMVAAGRPYRKKTASDQLPVLVRFCTDPAKVNKALEATSFQPGHRDLQRTQVPYPLPGWPLDDSTLFAWHLIHAEKWVSHLYLDSTGNVTVGVGHMLEDAAACTKLSFQGALPKQKTEEWQKIWNFKKQPKFNPQKHSAAWYKGRGAHNLVMGDKEIQTLMASDMDVYRNELRIWLKAVIYDECPLCVRLALLDMMYNVGRTKMRKYFDDLHKAIAKRDWNRAAAECKRDRIEASRNDFTKSLFLTAGRLES